MIAAALGVTEYVWFVVGSMWVEFGGGSPWVLVGVPRPGQRVACAEQPQRRLGLRPHLMPAKLRARPTKM